MKKTIKQTKIKLFSIVALGIIAICALSILPSCGQENSGHDEQAYGGKIEYSGLQSFDGYTLEQMNVVSRHNVRAPIIREGSLILTGTPHKWIDFSSDMGELTLHGAQIEHTMGQYFKTYLEKQNLISKNWVPQDDQALFYSNSIQRTIATAQNFATGMLPVANSKINHKYDVGKMDNFFVPAINGLNSKMEEQINKEVDQLGGSEGRSGINKDLEDSAKELENIVDFKDSEYAKSHNTEHIPNDPIVLKLENGKENAQEGLVKYGNQLADTLTMQYYEEPDNKTAGFGKDLTYDKMKVIDKFLKYSMKINCGTYTLACNSLNPMLAQLRKDFDNTGRKFTFYCGHDTTISSLVAALKVKDFHLPNTITDFAPIAGKAVFSTWKDANGEKWVTLNYVYPSTKQVRERETLGESNAPVAYPLELEGLTKNDKGMYKLSDIEQRFDESINVPNQYK